MPDIIAIISKGVFEQEARKGKGLLGVGAVLPLDRYVSKNKGLAPLAQGGRLVLVTVRPPNERLWLVAILEQPVFKGDMWVAPAPNTVPIADITPLRKTIKLAAGKGLSQDKGALGMSLQTPRALAPEDMVSLLAKLAPADGPAEIAARLPPSVTAATRALAADLAKTPDDEPLRERVVRKLFAEADAPDANALLAGWKHLNEHESGGLPCLCKKHIAAAPPRVTVSGLTLARDFVLKRGRLLHFWIPEDVLATGAEVHNSVRASLAIRVAALEKSRKQRARERTRARQRARAR
jgi:hypothetical protein